MNKWLIPAATLSLALASGCVDAETGPMPGTERQEILQIYDEFLNVDGVRAVVDFVEVEPVTGYLELNAPDSEAWGMFATLEPVGAYLTRSVRARDLPWYVLNEGMPGWPISTEGLSEEPEASWPSVAFLDVRTSIDGTDYAYRAVVVRRPGRAPRVFDPLIDPSSNGRAWLGNDEQRWDTVTEAVGDLPKESCPDDVENRRSTVNASYTCEGVWSSSVYRWKYEVNWTIRASCTEVTAEGEDGCHVTSAQTTKTSESVQHWIDDTLQATDGNNTYCDRAWPQDNIYFRVQTDTDTKQCVVHDSELDHDSGGHHQYALGLRIDAKIAADASPKNQLDVSLVATEGPDQEGHSVSGSHWSPGDYEGEADAPWEIAFENIDDYPHTTSCGNHYDAES